MVQQEIVGYKFKNIALLKEALTHPSCCKHKQFEVKNYQRLEFFGDSILGFIIAEILINKFPNASEGELSIIQSSLVNTSILANIARSIELGKLIILDAGEEKLDGRDKDRNLENAMEAVIAAIYLDSELITIRNIVHKLWEPYVSSATAIKNSKSQLQEWAQKNCKPIPQYSIVNKVGSMHQPIFTVAVQLTGMQVFYGQGKSKKIAEHDAAINMLNYLE